MFYWIELGNDYGASMSTLKRECGKESVALITYSGNIKKHVCQTHILDINRQTKKVIEKIEVDDKGKCQYLRHVND